MFLRCSIFFHIYFGNLITYYQVFNSKIHLKLLHIERRRKGGLSIGGQASSKRNPKYTCKLLDFIRSKIIS